MHDDQHYQTDHGGGKQSTGGQGQGYTTGELHSVGVRSRQIQSGLAMPSPRPGRVRAQSHFVRQVIVRQAGRVRAIEVGRRSVYGGQARQSSCRRVGLPWLACAGDMHARGREDRRVGAYMTNMLHAKCGHARAEHAESY